MVAPEVILRCESSEARRVDLRGTLTETDALKFKWCTAMWGARQPWICRATSMDVEEIQHDVTTKAPHYWSAALPSAIDAGRQGPGEIFQKVANKN